MAWFLRSSKCEYPSFAYGPLWSVTFERRGWRSLSWYPSDQLVEGRPTTGQAKARRIFSPSVTSLATVISCWSRADTQSRAKEEAIDGIRFLGRSSRSSSSCPHASLGWSAFRWTPSPRCAMFEPVEPRRAEKRITALESAPPAGLEAAHSLAFWRMHLIGHCPTVATDDWLSCSLFHHLTRTVFVSGDARSALDELPSDGQLCLFLYLGVRPLWRLCPFPLKLDPITRIISGLIAVTYHLRRYCTFESTIYAHSLDILSMLFRNTGSC